MIALDTNILARYLLNDDPEQSKAAVCRAIQWYEEGMDFGDALHLALSARDEKLLTFDRSLAKLAGKIGAAPGVAEAL